MHRMRSKLNHWSGNASKASIEGDEETVLASGMLQGKNREGKEGRRTTSGQEIKKTLQLKRSKVIESIENTKVTQKEKDQRKGQR